MLKGQVLAVTRGKEDGDVRHGKHFQVVGRIAAGDDCWALGAPVKVFKNLLYRRSLGSVGIQNRLKAAAVNDLQADEPQDFTEFFQRFWVVFPYQGNAGSTLFGINRTAFVQSS